MPAPALFEAKRRQSSREEGDHEIESGSKTQALEEEADKRNDSEDPKPAQNQDHPPALREEATLVSESRPDVEPRRHSNPEEKTDENDDDFVKPPPPRTITFDTATNVHPKNDDTLYIPGPRDRDRGQPLIELSKKLSVSHDGKPSLFLRLVLATDNPRP